MDKINKMRVSNEGVDKKNANKKNCKYLMKRLTRRIKLGKLGAQEIKVRKIGVSNKDIDMKYNISKEKLGERGPDRLITPINTGSRT